MLLARVHFLFDLLETGGAAHTGPVLAFFGGLLHVVDHAFGLFGAHRLYFGYFFFLADFAFCGGSGLGRFFGFDSLSWLGYLWLGLGGDGGGGLAGWRWHLGGGAHGFLLAK